MDKLLAYISSLPLADREPFAARCETTVGYLRKACYINQKISEGMCLRIAAESNFQVNLEDLRPDVDWSRLRVGLCKPELTKTPANQAQPAIKTVTDCNGVAHCQDHAAAPVVGVAVCQANGQGV